LTIDYCLFIEKVGMQIHGDVPGAGFEPATSRLWVLPLLWRSGALTRLSSQAYSFYSAMFSTPASPGM